MINKGCPLYTYSMINRGCFLYTYSMIFSTGCPLYSKSMINKGYPFYIYSMIHKSQLNSVHKSYHLLIIDFSLKPQSHACSLLIERLIKLFCQLYLLKPFQCRLKSMLILQEPVYCKSFSPKIAL